MGFTIIDDKVVEALYSTCSGALLADLEQAGLLGVPFPARQVKPPSPPPPLPPSSFARGLHNLLPLLQQEADALGVAQRPHPAPA